MKSAAAILKKTIVAYIQSLMDSRVIPTGVVLQTGSSGQPTKVGSQMFIAVHSAQSTNKAPEGASYDREIWSVTVTVSVHGTHIPHDQFFQGIDAIEDGVDLVCRVIDSSISHNLSLVDSANLELRPDPLFVAGIPLRPQKFSDCIPKSGAWWSASENKQVAGYVKVLPFSGLERYIPRY